MFQDIDFTIETIVQCCLFGKKMRDCTQPQEVQARWGAFRFGGKALCSQITPISLPLSAY